LPNACFSRRLIRQSLWRSLSPHASCLFREFALFYAKLTSARFLNPVTFLILHHRPDWLSSSRTFRFYGLMGGFDREGSVKCVIARPDSEMLTPKCCRKEKARGNSQISQQRMPDPQSDPQSSKTNDSDSTLNAWKGALKFHPRSRYGEQRS
jgi:hypothetical protein